MNVLDELKRIFSQNADKRIAVIGTTCTGKTTLLKGTSEGVETSSLLPPVTDEERERYYRMPLTKEINDWFVARGENAKIDPGKPAFGTVIPGNAELVVYLKIDDDLLRQRTQLRNVDFADAKLMQQFIEEQIRSSNLPIVTLSIASQRLGSQ